MIFIVAIDSTVATQCATDRGLPEGGWIYLDVMLRLRGKGYGPQHTMVFAGNYEAAELYAAALEYATRGEFVIEYAP